MGLMALGRLFIILTVIAIATCDYKDEIKAENKAKKALAAENEQKARSATPNRERGSLHFLSDMMNRTEERRQSRRRGKDSISKILQMNRKHQAQNENTMMNDKENVFAINEKKIADNDTYTFPRKMKELSKVQTTYEAVNKNPIIPEITGVFCNFETSGNSSDPDVCMWEWNSTVSSHGLGFQVLRADDIVRMNETSTSLKFTGPTIDADGNPEGHFLYLPVDPTMENMVIKSPPLRGLYEFCKFEVRLHQSKMNNASIRLISESTATEVQLILQEVAGNNLEEWYPMTFMIGRVQQEIRLIIEIVRGVAISLVTPLPHIAVDDIRMTDCFPESPIFNGHCQPTQTKCRIMNMESCINIHQICDLVTDCDDGTDENKNCDKMPYGSYCNFEQDTCGFVNIPQPILKWSRHSGPTPTDKTGPNYDHTCGPPELYPPTHVVPPLTPAHMNHTLNHCVGYYFFVNMNVTGPNKERADFASTAVMKTAVFNPPPRVHGNLTSKYYNCCVVRFYYQQNGRNYGSLSVELVELRPLGNISTPLWFSTKDKGEQWYRALIHLPNVTSRYYLQFKTRMGMRIYSDSAIDDFSMAPECFGLNIDPDHLGDYNYYDPGLHEDVTPHRAFANKKVYRFSPCGAVGRSGPNQTMCDAHYNGTVHVKVVETPPYRGIQVWETPEEGIYTILAIGASGGFGSSRVGFSHGAVSRGVFHLRRGERLYMLVGQQGTHACKKSLSAQETQYCILRDTNSSQQYRSKTHEVRNTEVRDGGGGGGGGTFVFLMDEGTATPLVVGGGGGGISVGMFRDDGSQYGRGIDNTTRDKEIRTSTGLTAGPGGGWISLSSSSTSLSRGSAVSGGGGGGAACAGPAHGGFGGGGGGCRRGGAGGGYYGGNINVGEHGGGGYSYVDQSRAIAEFTAVSLAHRMGDGEVIIIPAIHDCGCAYRCVALNEYRNLVKCYCPSTWSTHNGTQCILEDDWPRISLMLVSVMTAVVFIFALIVLCGCLYLYNLYQRKKEEELRRKQLLEQEVQLHRLRHGAGENTLTAFNPHYGTDLLGPDCAALPQVCRTSLRLLKALGQGAFGEVYQGLYKHRTGDSSEMPVAVKTLPELSTTQAEQDFLMEAAIMAKFNHPNIVHLIGVCFDRHPRFIVLELLAGGDLKVFLRESRPRAERASALTMKDLLMCAADVCKGCRYLELQRFIHRDIAARNCLLTSRGPGRVVKIADFGMARDIYRSDYYKKGGKALLPIKWMPPEAYRDGVFTVKTDVWSFGVLTWEVFALGVMPYHGCTNREVMDMVSDGGRLEKPPGCPQEIYILMCECWKPDPEDRPSFAQMFDRLTALLQDSELVSQPLPIMKALGNPVECFSDGDNIQRPPPCDYLVPLSPPDNTSTTDHSKSLTATPTHRDQEDSRYPHLSKASQEYGNIQNASDTRGAAPGSSCAQEATTPGNFLQSNSTDRLLSPDDNDSILTSDSDNDNQPTVWETSFIENKPPVVKTAEKEGPAVDKLISITPTSPKPPENALTKAIEFNSIDHLSVDRKPAPIASPEPPRINPWPKDQTNTPKQKPLCLDAAKLEQNLNALKKNSGSVILTTMNIVPPYINVVTPNKQSDTKTIQIDPKKAVIYDLQSPKEEEEPKLKQSNSSASLLNGPMTEVPYADSDNGSSSSEGSTNNIKIIQKSIQNNYTDVNIGQLKKQTSNGDIHNNDSEISC